MSRYSEERKQAILSKLSPPHNLSVSEVARSEGIGVQTLYNWRNQAREQGQPM
ncbi:transposase, partial [Psychrobacter pasteurii]